ncbi:hypothetical protein SLEP1_g12638 [Rubroshorea leprosula]|uniref:Integrase catalytic domain-containing protein n=1 Tax=Rubroshorea leprosula TaxID=152421 RepID=A0AAV5ID64_9ROSI|nr:hypothetical protein SLEP1_g12638 [Rubroshorea leprosula]
MEDLFHIQFYRSKPEISMADLSRLTQRPRESFENYLMQFRKARMKCHVALPEQEFVKLAQNDKPVTCPNLVKVTQQVEAAAKHLSYESGRQYTFDVTKANEIFNYLKKSRHIKLPQGHRLLTVAEIASKDYCKIDKGLLRFPEKPKEAMRADENPFSNVDVGVNVADIRSISRRTYKGRTLAVDDLHWVIEKERERHAQHNQRPGGQRHAARIYASGSKMKEARHIDHSCMRAEAHRRQQLATEEVKVPQRSSAKGRMVWKRKESQKVVVQNESQPEVPPPKLTSLIVNENELKATFEADQQAELTSDDNLLEDMDVLQIGSICINLSCLVLTLPLVFQAKGNETTHVPTHVSNGSMFVEEEVIEVPAQEEEKEHNIRSEQIIFNKPNESMARHIKPLYISAHMDGVPVNRVLVDNGAVVNVIPSFMLRNLGKNSEDLVYTDVTISDFTGGVSKSKGVLPIALTVGSKTSMSAFFVVDSSATYNALLGRDWIHSNWCVPSTLHQRLIFWNGGKTEVVYADNGPFLANSNMVEARYYDEDVGTIHFFGMDRQGRPRGITACNKPTLAKYVVDKVVHEGEEDTYTDGVTMEELDLALAKLDDLKADVQDPLKEVNLGTEAEPHVTFVIVKKNGKLRVCIDFQNLNLATPKDQYPMPVADLLVNGVARHRILSFMDGYSGYNQIFIAEEDISEMTFRCLGNICKTRVFSPLLKLQPDVDFKWERQHQATFDVIKEYLSKPPVLVPPAVKGQALADFLADHPCLDVNADEDKGINLFLIDLVPWRLIFYGSSTNQAFEARIIIVSPYGIKTQWCFQLDFEYTNNQAKYEALVIGLELLVELKVPSVEIVGDSQLVLKQLSGEYKCTSVVLSPYFVIAIQLLEEFDDVSLKHIPHSMNIETNELAQIASDVKMPEGILEKVIVIEKRMLPSINQRGITVEACSLDVTPTDLRHPKMKHLRNPNSKTSRRMRMQALNYVILGDVLYRIKMRWLIRRHGFFWPSILKDCINYAKGCRACQLHGPLQRAPASELHPIVKPWPFRGWAIDLIGKIYPPSSKGTAFVGSQVEAFAKDMGFHLLNSTPHYAQANGRAEASNKIIINTLEKMVDDNPKRWHELLLDTLWAYRSSQRSSTKVTPFSLTYGHDAILPMELTARSLWIAIQNGLNSGEYNEAMIMELEDLEEARLTALDVMKVHKLKVARAYNKKVKQKNLAEGSLVWKVVLPLGKKDLRYGKWSPNWEGPFQIHKVLKGGAFWLKSLNGELHPRKINGIYLKPYYPTVWEARDSSASSTSA